MDLPAKSSWAGLAAKNRFRLRLKVRGGFHIRA
jgi:hypothetical protein